MLTRDVRFEGWSASDWIRLLSLAQTPLPESPQESSPPVHGGLLLVHETGVLRKAFHTELGRIDAALLGWPEELPKIASLHRASWVLSVQQGALDELMDRFGALTRPEDDILGQLLTLGQLLKQMTAEGRLSTWPSSMERWPIPSYAIASRGLDGLCADGKLLLVGLFQDGELWTSLALRRRGLAFDWILGPDELRRDMGLLSGDWHRDQRFLVDAVEHRMDARLGAGLIAETHTLRALMTTATPGAWAKAVAIREILVWPLLGPAALPLGVDAARGALALAKRVSDRWLGSWGATAPGSPLEGVSQLLRQLLSRDMKM